MEADLDSSVHDWLFEYPQVLPVLNQWGIDTSCGGKSLRYLCQQQGRSPEALLQQLEQTINQRAE